MRDFEKATFPDEAEDEWKVCLDMTRLDVTFKANIMAIIKYTQPPVCIKALTIATRIYENDTQTNAQINQQVTDTIRQETNIEKELPKRIATLYPVFYAMTKHELLGDMDCEKSAMARKLMSKIFAHQSKTISRSRHIFYNDVLTVRHVCMAVVQAAIPSPNNHQEPEHFFIDSFDSDILHNTRTRMEEKLQTFLSLLNRRRIPGEREKSEYSVKRATGVRKKKKTRRDQWQREKLSSMRQAAPPQRTRVETESAAHNEKQNSMEIVNDKTISKIGMQKTRHPTAGHDDEDATESTYLKRNVPSLLSSTDDTLMARRWITNISTSSLPASTDIHRLVPDIIMKVLKTKMDNLEWTFALLLLATGISVNRLRFTVMASNDEYDPIQPIWHPEAHTLRYRVISPGKKADTCEWISLRLPATMAKSLLNESHSHPSKRPFQEVRRRLDGHLRRHFKTLPGIMPTATRLSASSWLISRRFARDDCAAATLSGDLTQRHAAPATYRQIPCSEIQHLFDMSLRHLQEMSKLDIIPEHYIGQENDMRDPSNGFIGSTKAEPPHTFRPLFSDIRYQISDSISKLYRTSGNSQSLLSLAVDLFQWTACHTLLAWQLSTGARPVGPSSQNILSEKHQWVADKNSAAAKEFRTIPLLPEIHKEIGAFHHWAENFLSFLNTQKITITDERRAQRDTPYWVQLHKSRLIVRDMTWADIKKNHALSSMANNCPRHSVATYLRDKVPESQIDFLLGHAREGQSLSAPHSTTGIEQLGELRATLKTWLRSCGFRTLRWEEMPWNY